MGAGSESRGARFLFGKPRDLSATSQRHFHQIWPQNVVQCPVDESGKTFSKIFTSRVIWNQSRLQVTGCTAERYCLLHVVVQGPGSFWGRSTFLYDVRLRQIWTKDVWKRTILRTDVPSHQISSHLPPKSSQNPILGELSMQTYYTDSSP